MSSGHAVATAVLFTWLGMVLAISFIEAPLKFRAPGVSLQVGLGIGRLVFRALNSVEAVLAAVVVITVGTDPPSALVIVAIGVAVVAVATQVLVVRPRLAHRSDAVLAAPAVSAPGGGSRRSRAHYEYVGLELVKVIALVLAGAALLGA